MLGNNAIIKVVVWSVLLFTRPQVSQTQHIFLLRAPSISDSPFSYLSLSLSLSLSSLSLCLCLSFSLSLSLSLSLSIFVCLSVCLSFIYLSPSVSLVLPPSVSLSFSLPPSVSLSFFLSLSLSLSPNSPNSPNSPSLLLSVRIRQQSTKLHFCQGHVSHTGTQTCFDKSMNLQILHDACTFVE